MKRSVVSWAGAGVAAATLAVLSFGAGTAGAQGAPARPAKAQDAPGKALFESVCSNCHEINVTTDQRKSRADWQATVDRMVGHGAPITGEQAVQITDYLAKTYALGK